MGARSVVFAAVVLVGLLVPVETALAGREWCETDPILEFANGTRVQWVTRFDSGYLGSLTGPVEFRYEVPANAGPIRVDFVASPARERVSIRYTGQPWNGQGAMPVTVSVLVQASARFATLTSVYGNVASDSYIRGRSNVPTAASAMVDASEWEDLVGSGSVVWSVTITDTATVTSP